MKKDSFTFSDKLKKSKTLPLSKRIPSRVGGEVKAKRTLFERAQRDLPFIIVAALALLLLPFLSRESGDVDTPSVVWGDGGDSYIEDFNKPESSEGEIALSSFRNPLDLIIRHGEKDGSARDAIDTYGAGDGEESSSDYSSSRSSYGSEEYSTSPATSRYGKTVKRTIRNSVNRVPTAIGSLRAGSMVSPGAGSGVGHSMALGSRAKDGAPRVQGPGVRPVALQPLQAAGKGRNLTGNDALYAEAARSIGAFNRPGAKQALMEAQLKDVDGKPLGDTKGAAAGAGPNRPGAGGNLANNWNHSPLKPWWWDMMQKRSQMRWELWHYNWEKMASDSLIKLTAGLASCLITGSNDFSVGKFLGSPGGGVDICCRTSFGEEICAGDLTDFASTTTGTGKDKETSNHAIDALRMVCPANAEFYPTQASRKSALDVRLRCLGLKLSELKNMTQVRRSAVCVNMYGDPMQVNISVKRNNKERVKQYRKMGYYVMGKKGDQECAFAINHAIPGINAVPYEKGMKKVVVYKVGATGVGFFPEGNADPTFDRNLEDYKNKKGDYNSEEEIYWESGDYYRGLREAEQKIQNAIDRGECLSEKRVQEILKTYGKWRTPANSMGRFNEVAVCPVPENRLEEGTLSPLRINTKDGTTSLNSSPYSGVVCDQTTAYIENAGGWHAISATIKNPGPRTIAVVMEEVQGGETASTGYFKNGEQTTIPERSGFLIKEVIDFSRETEGQKRSTTKKDENGNEYTETAFIGEFKVGLSSTIKDDAKGSNVLARSGKGYVLWITTDDVDVDKRIKYRNSVIYNTRVEDVIDKLPNKGYATGICNYIWGCGETDDCLDINKNYCRDAADGKIYKAVEYRGYLFRASKDPIEDQNVAYEVLQCEPVCQYKNGGASIVNQPGDKDPLPGIEPLTEKELQDHGIYVDPNCPTCNLSEPKRATGPGLVCVNPEKIDINGEYETCPCIKVDNPITPKQTPIPGTLYIRSDITTPERQEVELPVTPICHFREKGIVHGNIYVRNPADNTPIEKVDPDEAIVNELKTKSPQELETLCPFCNPNADEGKGKCYIGNDIYPSVSFTGIDGKTYYIRTSQTSTNGNTSYPCTPICAAKAKALGIFQTEGPNSAVPVDPESPLTSNVNAIKPVQPGTPLCPFCSEEDLDISPNPCEANFEDIFVFAQSDAFNAKGNQEMAQKIKDFHYCINHDPTITTIQVEGHTDASTHRGKDPTQNAADNSGLVMPTITKPGCNHPTSPQNLYLAMNRARYVTKNFLNGYGGVQGLVKQNPNIKFVVVEHQDPKQKQSSAFGHNLTINPKVYNSGAPRTITFNLTPYGSHCAQEQPECNSDGTCPYQSEESKDNMRHDRKVVAYMERN